MMEGQLEELIPLLKGYGLPGLIVLAVMTYIWKVHVPRMNKLDDEKRSERDSHQKMVTDTIEKADKRSEALVTAFREDIKEIKNDFLESLDDVEKRHEASCEKIIDVIRNLNIDK